MLKLMRFVISFSTLTRSVSFLIASLRKINISTSRIDLIGFLIFGVTNDFLTSCFSLFILIWFQLCSRILPEEFPDIYESFKILFLFFNLIVYLMRVNEIFLCFLTQDILQEPIYAVIYSSYFLLSDTFLTVCCFYLFFKIQKNFGHNLNTSIRNEKNGLMIKVFVLGIFLFLRGLVDLLETILSFFSSKSFCSYSILVVIMFQSIIIDNIPFIITTYQNNKLLREQNSQSDINSLNLIS